MKTKLFDVAFLHDSYETCTGVEDSGIKGFFADSIWEIVMLVEKGPDKRKTILKQQASYAAYVTEELVSKQHGEYRYFYYDPNYEAKYAFLIEHKPIQFYDEDKTQWRDYLGDYDNPPADWQEYKWCVKPEDKIPQLTPEGRSMIQEAVTKRVQQIITAIIDNDYNMLQGCMVCGIMNDEDFYKCFEE